VGEKCSEKFRLRIRLPRNSRDLLHAANLRHGTDGFTSPPKEGVLKIFSLRPGLNPRTWVPKASTLPLDRRQYDNKFSVDFLLDSMQQNVPHYSCRHSQAVPQFSQLVASLVGKLSFKITVNICVTFALRLNVQSSLLLVAQML
jgi:hypothetical protein